MKNPGSPSHDAGGGPLKTNRPELDTSTPQSLIKSVPWHHGFELLPGLVTSGQNRLFAKGARDAFGVSRETIADGETIERLLF